MIGSDSESYYAQYQRSKGPSKLQTSRLMTDRAAYVGYLEVQLERVTAACLAATACEARVDEVQAAVVGMDKKIMQMSELAKLAIAYAEAAGSDSAMAVSAATQRLDEAAAAQVGVIEEVEAVAAEALKRASSGAASIEELRTQVTAAHSSLAGHDTSILALDEASQAAADTVKKLVAELKATRAGSAQELAATADGLRREQAALQQSVELIQKDTTLVHQRMHVLETSLVDISRAVQSTTVQAENSEQELARVDARVSSVVDNMKQARSEAHHLSQAVAAATQQSREQGEAVDELRQGLDGVSTGHRDMQQTVAGVQESVGDIAGRVGGVEARLQRLHQRVEERAASAVAAAAPGAATTIVAVPPAMAEAVAAATREANRAATVSARSEGAVKGLVTRVARLEAAAATGAGQTTQAPLELSQRVNQCEAAMEERCNALAADVTALRSSLHHIQQQQQQQERQAASKPSPSPSPHAQARAATPPLKRRGSESAGGSDATTQLLLQDVLARLATVEQRAESAEKVAAQAVAALAKERRRFAEAQASTAGAQTAAADAATAAATAATEASVRAQKAEGQAQEASRDVRTLNESLQALERQLEHLMSSNHSNAKGSGAGTPPHQPRQPPAAPAMAEAAAASQAALQERVSALAARVNVHHEQLGHQLGHMERLSASVEGVKASQHEALQQVMTGLGAANRSLSAHRTVLDGLPQQLQQVTAGARAAAEAVAKEQCSEVLRRSQEQTGEVMAAVSQLQARLEESSNADSSATATATATTPTPTPQLSRGEVEAIVARHDASTSIALRGFEDSVASLDARLRAAEVGRETLQVSLAKHGAAVESLRGDIGEVVKQDMSQALAAAVMAVQRGLEARLSSAAAAHKESLAAIRGEASTALARADRCLALNSQLQERVAAQLASVERRQGRVRIETAAAPPPPPAQQVATSGSGATAAQVAASMANTSFAPVAHVQLPSHAPSVSPVTAKAAPPAPAPAPAPVPPPPAASVPASAVGGGGGSTRAGARKAGARPLGRKSSTRSSKSTTSTSSKRLRRAGSRTGSASSLSSFASSTSSAREVSLALTKDERRRLRKLHSKLKQQGSM